MHAAADEDDTVLRISLDAKATVLIGLFSRKGKTRLFVRAMDHDLGAEDKLTPFGIFVPRYDEFYTNSICTSPRHA
jgi:hypothetical protein